jgi:hypothetical protein
MSYTILYSGDAVVCTLDALVVSGELPNPSPVSGAITATVGFITVSAALQNLDVRHVQYITLDPLTIQLALESPTATAGALTAIADILSIIASLPAPVALGTGSLTATVDELSVTVTLPGLSIPSLLDPILIQASLMDMTAILSGMVTDTLDVINVGVVLPSPTMIPAPTTAAAGFAGVQVNPRELRGVAIPRPVSVVYTTDTTWGGIFLARPEPGLTEDKALMTTAGFTVALERAEAGETHVYVWGTTAQVANWTGTMVMLQNQLPYFFWKVASGVPMTIDLLLRGPVHPGDLIKF